MKKDLIFKSYSIKSNALMQKKNKQRFLGDVYFYLPKTKCNRTTL